MLGRKTLSPLLCAGIIAVVVQGAPRVAWAQLASPPRALGINAAPDEGLGDRLTELEDDIRAVEDDLRIAAVQVPTLALVSEPWMWQFLPDGLIYHSYLAGVKEPRMGAVFNTDRRGDKTYVDAALGARFGLWRFGTGNDARPEGWQMDLEAAAFPRMHMENDWEMVGTDFRVGLPLTYGRGRWQIKAGYYHISAHLGDEYAVRTGSSRINFSRDAAIVGLSFYLTDNVRLYGEVAWAFQIDGGSEPWETQFGIEYSPATPSSVWGGPFLAANAHLRQELDFSGNLVAQVGWQWRARHGTRLLRIGAQYYNGMSQQYEFFREFEELLGLGMWYDF